MIAGLGPGQSTECISAAAEAVHDFNLDTLMQGRLSTSRGLIVVFGFDFWAGLKDVLVRTLGCSWVLRCYELMRLS